VDEKPASHNPSIVIEQTERGHYKTHHPKLNLKPAAGVSKFMTMPVKLVAIVSVHGAEMAPLDSAKPIADSNSIQ
jgi:hypothetical protein